FARSSQTRIPEPLRTDGTMTAVCLESYAGRMEEQRPGESFPLRARCFPIRRIAVPFAPPWWRTKYPMEEKPGEQK
ncbi:hypothetical protein V2S84_13870, partial [Azotobacter chroococcum]|nr:hypothetical protein [Azotobacter chroococcum]